MLAGSTGVSGGSAAAAWQASIGNVAAASPFASLQSIGAAGIGVAVPAVAGAGVGVLTAAGMAAHYYRHAILCASAALQLPAVRPMRLKAAAYRRGWNGG